MAKGDWWFKFQWDDWLGDEKLGFCSFETQGFWLRCICIMRRSGTYELKGSVEDLRRLIGCLPEEVMRCASELKRTDAADVTIGNAEVTIKSRRLYRELNAKESNKLRKRKQRGHADVTEDSADRVRTRVKDNKEEEPATQDGETAVAVDVPVVRRIWKDGVDLLTQDGQPEPKARSLLGRLAKEYGQDRLAECIAVAQSRNPVGVEAFLIACLKERSNGNGTNQRKSEREKSAERGFNAESFADQLEREARAEMEALSGDDVAGGPPVHQLGERSIAH